MADPNKTVDQNLLPVQAYFNADGSFNTFIGQNQPFVAVINPLQSGLNITNSLINSTIIGGVTPSSGNFTNISTTTGTISTIASGPTDIVNKNYVDAVSTGLSFKQPALVTTTGNITLSGLQTVDGIALNVGDRVLVRNQTAAATNGIYSAATSAWIRTTDADSYNEFLAAYLFVIEGTIWAGSAWVCTDQPGGTLGTTPINFIQFSNNASYSAGTGLTLSGFQFSITPQGTAGTYGSASSVPVFNTNASGQVTSVTPTAAAIDTTQVVSGTLASARLAGAYGGITGVGTLASGTWNGSTITVPYGGTGAVSLTGYVKGTGTAALTASTTIPSTDITGFGTMASQNANNVAITGGTISGLSAAIPVPSGGTGATTLTGYLSGNGTSAITGSATIPNTAITGLGTMSTQNASGVIITGGTLNGVAIGQTTAGDGTFNALNGSTSNVGVATASSLNIGTLPYTPTGALITSQSSVIRRNQVIISNTNNSSITASAGYVVNNSNSTATSFYGDFGINGSAFTGSGAFNQSNNIYLAAVSSDLVIGTKSSNPIHFVVNNGATDAMTVSNAGIVSFGTALAIASGGTNGTATPTAGAVPYGTGSAYAFSAVGSAGQVLTSNGVGVPTWTTPTSYATVTDDTTTASTRYPLFAAATSGNLVTEYTSSTKYQYVPSTGILSATGFSGAHNGTIGATTLATGAFTTLSASNTISGAGFTAYLASPPAIGGTAASTGAFTSITASADSSFTSTGALLLPAGTTAQQPTGVAGKLRFNSTTTQFEGYNGSVWASVGGAAISNDTATASFVYPLFANATSGTALTVYTSNAKYLYKPSTGELQAPVVNVTNGLQVNSKTVSVSYAIPSGSSAISAGPMTVASGQSVTVPSGSKWVVL